VGDRHRTGVRRAHLAGLAGAEGAVGAGLRPVAEPAAGRGEEGTPVTADAGVVDRLGPVVGSSSRREARRFALARTSIVAGILALWFALVRTELVPARLLPDPVDVARALWEIIGTAGFRTS